MHAILALCYAQSDDNSTGPDSDIMSNPKQKQNKDVKHSVKTNVIVKPKVNELSNRHNVVRGHIRSISAALSKLKSVVSTNAVSGYFDVKDNKSVTVSETADLKLAQYELEMLKGVARAAIGATGLKTRVIFKTTANSGAGAALATVIGIVPSNAVEWASFQALFDDYKVISATTHYNFASSVASTANATPSYGVAFDATYNAAPVSVATVMESDRHQIGMLDPAANYPVAIHPSFSKNGFRSFHIREPRSAIISPSAVTGGTGIVTNLPGSWIDMGDASSTSSGYFKFYFEATTTSVITLTQFMEIEVMFRQRT